MESRRDKLSLSFAKKCIKSTKQRNLFPTAVHPHVHQLRRQEHYHVKQARTEEYRKSAILYLYPENVEPSIKAYLYINISVKVDKYFI